MKKFVATISLAMVYTLFSFALQAQTEFIWQNPKPQGNTFYSVTFIDSETGWAAGSHGTIMKTMDGGKTWIAQESNSTATLTSIFFIDRLTGWAVGGNTVLNTTDGGQTWDVLTSDAPTILSSVYFFDAETGIITGFGRIFKTTDGGRTLTAAAPGTTVGFSNILSVFFLNSRLGWSVGTNGRVLNTTDGGDTWNVQASNTTNRLNSVNFSDSLNGYAFGDYGTRLVTSDGGVNWSSSAVMYNHINSTFFIDANIGWAVTESNSDSTTIYKTIDGGLSWESYWAGSNRALTSIDFIDASRGWIVGHGGKMLWTTDGGSSWTEISKGMTTPLISVFFLNPLLGWAVGEAGGIVKTMNGGNTWSSGAMPYATWLNDVFFINKDTGFLATGFGTHQIYKTHDGGDTWKEAVAPGSDYFLNAIHFSDRRVGWCAGLNGIILKTVNSGDSWTELTSGTTSHLYSVHFHNPDSARIPMVPNINLGFAAGSNGTILRTSNGGQTWSPQISGTTVTINSVFFTDSLNGWCAGQSGLLLRTNDSGVTWEKLNSNVYTTLFGIQFINAQIGFAVGDYGVILRTTDGGDSWSPLSSGTANTLFSLCFSDANTGYVVGRYGTILKTINGGGTFIEDIKSPESLYSLYPNPANNKITIAHSGIMANDALISIVDLNGRTVMKEMFADKNRVEIDVSNFARGVYLILIKTNQGIESKKLVID
jgi:photosystem II stability/assembly factor-like uncharacterized protein